METTYDENLTHTCTELYGADDTCYKDNRLVNSMFSLDRVESQSSSLRADNDLLLSDKNIFDSENSGTPLLCRSSTVENSFIPQSLSAMDELEEYPQETISGSYKDDRLVNSTFSPDRVEFQSASLLADNDLLLPNEQTIDSKSRNDNFMNRVDNNSGIPILFQSSAVENSFNQQPYHQGNISENINNRRTSNVLFKNRNEAKQEAGLAHGGPNNPVYEDHFDYRHDASVYSSVLANQCHRNFQAESMYNAPHRLHSAPWGSNHYLIKNTTGWDGHAQNQHELYFIPCEDVTPLYSEGAEDIPTAKSLSAYFINASEHYYHCYNGEQTYKNCTSTSNVPAESTVSLIRHGHQSTDQVKDRYNSSPRVRLRSYSVPQDNIRQLQPMPLVDASPRLPTLPIDSERPGSQCKSFAVDGAIAKVTKTTSCNDCYKSIPLHPNQGVLLKNLIKPSDRKIVSAFTNAIMDELEIASFCLRDRKGTRNALPIGFAGMTCRHCKGMNSRTGGRYFPSSIKTMSDSKKTLLAIRHHLLGCGKCPKKVKDRIEKLFHDHIEKRKRGPGAGTQRAFFREVFAILHPLSIGGK